MAFFSASLGLLALPVSQVVTCLLRALREDESVVLRLREDESELFLDLSFSGLLWVSSRLFIEILPASFEKLINFCGNPITNVTKDGKPFLLAPLGLAGIGEGPIGADFRKEGGGKRTTSLLYEKVYVSNHLSQEKRCQYQLMIAKCRQECKKLTSMM
jgi:hypothetical protein